MILLNESSSNTFVIQPTASFADGSSFVYRFTDVFSQDQFLGIATGSKYGNWVKLPINVSTSSYTIGVNTSTLPLKGGTYEIKVFSAPVVTPSIYGTETRTWGLIGSIWSYVPGIPIVNGNGIWTSRAWVSESIGRMNYTSTNEIAAYVVYNG
jgi:hypothetical protein